MSSHLEQLNSNNTEKKEFNIEKYLEKLRENRINLTEVHLKEFRDTLSSVSEENKENKATNFLKEKWYSVTPSKETPLIEKLKKEAYQKVDEIIKEKGWVLWKVLWWLWIYSVWDSAKDYLEKKLNEDSDKEEEKEEEGILKKIKNIFSLKNITKWISWIHLASSWIKWKIDGVYNDFKDWKDKLLSKWEEIVEWGTTKAKELVEKGKEFKEKFKEKEKIEFNPDSIYSNFNQMYLKLLVWNKGTTNSIYSEKLFKKIENTTFSEINKNLTDKEKIVVKELKSEDSVNLLTPFLSSKKYLLSILDSELIKKTFNKETPNRTKELKSTIENNNFDWKETFTWKEVTIIMSQNLAYFGQAGLKWIKWVISPQELINSIKDIDDIDTLTETLPLEAKHKLNILKYSYIKQNTWNISNLSEESFNSTDKDKKEENKYSKEVYDFSNNFLNSSVLSDLESDLEIDIDLKNTINNKFALFTMSKLYILLDWKVDYSNWWDSEKITFITWLTNSLWEIDDYNKVSQIWSSLITKIAKDEDNWGFVSSWVRNFFKSWAKILWERALNDELIRPYDIIKGVIEEKIWNKIGVKGVEKVISNSTANIAIALWVLVMLYPAYKITKLLTHPVVLTSIVGAWIYMYVKNNAIKDLTPDFLKWITKDIEEKIKEIT